MFKGFIRFINLLFGSNNNTCYYINSTNILPPPLSDEEEEKNLVEFKNGSIEARNLLITHNLRLVVYIAKKFESTKINIEDLISIGSMGLIKAVQTFKMEKNIKLATYASRCIENEILMHFAGSSGDDVVFLGQGLVVDVVDDGGQIVACGSRDDDLLSACVDVSLSLSLGAVEAGALQDNVDTQLAPGQLGSVSLSVDGQLLAVDDDVVLASLDSVSTEGSSVSALGGVILQQVSQHLGRGQVIDSDNLKTLSTEHLTESQTADTAEAVDSNFNRHVNFLHFKCAFMAIE